MKSALYGGKEQNFTGNKKLGRNFDNQQKKHLVNLHFKSFIIEIKNNNLQKKTHKKQYYESKWNNK